jgi:hypothetical protein
MRIARGSASIRREEPVGLFTGHVSDVLRGRAAQADMVADLLRLLATQWHA